MCLHWTHTRTHTHPPSHHLRPFPLCDCCRTWLIHTHSQMGGGGSVQLTPQCMVDQRSPRQPISCCLSCWCWRRASPPLCLSGWVCCTGSSTSRPGPASPRQPGLIYEADLSCFLDVLYCFMIGFLVCSKLLLKQAYRSRLDDACSSAATLPL